MFLVVVSQTVALKQAGPSWPVVAPVPFSNEIFNLSFHLTLAIKYSCAMFSVWMPIFGGKIVALKVQNLFKEFLTIKKRQGRLFILSLLYPQIVSTKCKTSNVCLTGKFVFS